MRWRRVVADVFCEFSGEQDSLFETLWHHFAEARHRVVFDDVVTTWHELARRGYQVAIASNFDQRLEQICRDLFPLSNCRHVFPSSRVGWSKPSPAFFRAIEETLQLEPAQLLLVGDDPRYDVAGALAAGWHARWLVREAESRPESALAGPAVACGFQGGLLFLQDFEQRVHPKIP